MASAAAAPRSLARRVGRLAARTAGVGAAGAALGGGYLYATEPGFERSARFWVRAGPIVFNYWWQKTLSANEEDRWARYERLHSVHSQDARRLIEDLRGMFVKVAQVLSVRPEVVPDAYRAEFRKLQDSAPPSRWESVEAALRRDLGDVARSFDSIDKEPLGAASIGQAHLVRWRGREAVVKVQYPDAASMMHADFRCLEILLWLVGEADALRITRQIRVQFEVELDYAQEAVHLRGLHQAIMSSPEFAGRVAVPEPIPELTGGNVVGMEYLPGLQLERVLRQRLEALGVDLRGKSLSEWAAAKQQQEGGLGKLEGSHPVPEPGPPPPGDGEVAGASPVGGLGATMRHVALRLFGIDLILRAVRAWADIRLYFARRPSSERLVATEDLRRMLQLVLDVHGFQLFFCPFFNGDPHPGNILLLPDGRVGLIDFGQCKSLSRDERAGIAELLLAVSEPADAPGNARRVAEAFFATGVKTEKSDERFCSLMPRLMFCSLQGEWLDRDHLREVLRGDKFVNMPTHLLMAYRSAMLLRGLCLVLQENVSVADAWRPYAERWLCEDAAAAAAPA